MQNVHFTPPQLARMLKVNESTVKRWIDRGILKAVRTAGGHRRIREQDLRTFLQSQDKAQKYSYVLSRYAKRAGSPDVWRRYFRLHRDRRPAEARELLTGAYISSGSLLHIIQNVIVPALVEIGEEWRAGRLDIADEHRMTFLIRADVLALEMLVPAPKINAPHVLLACVPEENHELALILLALIAREQGWRTTVLGINVPVREVAREAFHSQPDLIALAKLYRGATGVPYIRAIRHEPVCADVPIVVGGGGWSSADSATMKRMKDVSRVASFEEFSTVLDQLNAHAHTS